MLDEPLRVIVILVQPSIRHWVVLSPEQVASVVRGLRDEGPSLKIAQGLFKPTEVIWVRNSHMSDAMTDSLEVLLASFP